MTQNKDRAQTTPAAGDGNKQPVEGLKGKPSHIEAQNNPEKMEKMNMRQMAEQNVAFHEKATPEAEAHSMDAFPAPVMRGLFSGMLGGTLVGIFWAFLLIHNLATIPGWEGLYSMAPGAFYVFWAALGLALGGFTAGAAAILLYPEQRHRPEEEPGDDL